MAKLNVPSDGIAMAQSQPSHTEMHREHVEWQSEANAWRDDLRAWEEETHHILKKQPDIKEAFEKHLAALQTHESLIRLYEQQANEHERVMADFERGASGETLIELAQKHKRVAERHAHQRNSHEVIKKLHRTAVSRWRSLAKSLQEEARQNNPKPHWVPE